MSGKILFIIMQFGLRTKAALFQLPVFVTRHFMSSALNSALSEVKCTIGGSFIQHAPVHFRFSVPYLNLSLGKASFISTFINSSPFQPVAASNSASILYMVD